jgi:hypothetical protein
LELRIKAFLEVLFTDAFSILSLPLHFVMEVHNLLVSGVVFEVSKPGIFINDSPEEVLEMLSLIPIGFVTCYRNSPSGLFLVNPRPH